MQITKNVYKLRKQASCSQVKPDSLANNKNMFIKAKDIHELHVKSVHQMWQFPPEL